MKELCPILRPEVSVPSASGEIMAYECISIKMFFRPSVWFPAYCQKSFQEGTTQSGLCEAPIASLLGQ